MEEIIPNSEIKMAGMRQQKHFGKIAGLPAAVW